MKKSKLIRTSAIALTAAALLGTGALAGGAVTTRMIEATFADIKLVVDGVWFTPRDANGTPVQPFAIQGTTYLPLRAVAEALGVDIEWEGETKTIYIGEIPNQETNWMKQGLPPYMVGYKCAAYDGSDHRNSFTVAGIPQTIGVSLFDDDSGTNDASAGFAIWNTNFQYSSMTFTIGNAGGNTKNGQLDVYLDGQFATSYDVAWDSSPQTVTIPLNYSANVKLALNGYTLYDDGSKYYTYGAKYGIYDISFAE